MTKVCIVGLIVAGLGVSGGCKKSSESLAEKLAEKAIEKSSGGKAKVDISGGTVKVQTKDGEMVATSGANASVPDDFPKDVLVLDGAKVLASVKVPDGFAVTMETKEASESVVKKYADAMKAHGWAETATVKMGEGVMLAYGKEKEGRTTSVMISKDSHATQLQLTVMKNRTSDAKTEEKAAAEAGANQ